MALPNLKLSPAELASLWTRRIVSSVLLVLLEFVIFSKFLTSPPWWIGFATSPCLAFATWQVVARIVTTEHFRFSLDPMVRNSKQLADVLFTVAFALNALYFVYHLYSYLPAELR